MCLSMKRWKGNINDAYRDRKVRDENGMERRYMRVNAHDRTPPNACPTMCKKALPSKVDEVMK